MTQPDYREKARDMAEEARKLYPGNLFDQLDYLLGATRLSFEEAGLAWIACQKLFPQLRDSHKESLRQAHLAGRREGIEAAVGACDTRRKQWQMNAAVDANCGDHNLAGFSRDKCTEAEMCKRAVLALLEGGK